MKRASLVTLAITLLLVFASASAFASEKCGGADIANGPFAYTALGITNTTFNGTGGSAVSTSFSVRAPSPDNDTDAPNVFPGQGQNACLGQADASILVLEVQKVGDANGNPITPINLDPNSGLGLQIVSAFVLSPNANTFTPGSSVTVNVTVNNPNVASADYGDYDVKLAAQAPGAGIGVGNGPHFFLSLRPPACTDQTPPVVTVTKPTGDDILGVTGVEVQANDPVGNCNEGTGVVSLTATISSAGGAVSNQPIALTDNPTLPVPAGITVIGTGSFQPYGGSGSPGTTDASAFTGALNNCTGNCSGIGNYTINATAIDGAGNPGYGSKNFNINYTTAFTTLFSPPPCKTGGNSSCTGQFGWTANRSGTTSDGLFMYDHTVIAELHTVSPDVVVATHVYGTGSVLSFVQITATPTYLTHFRRGDIGGTSPAAYYLKVYYLNIDGSRSLQATSGSLTF